jgi:hypothetical protein
MFELEKSIANWREQMLAAGIKTPVPLEELEIHLREEIRALVSTGTPENEAFQLAASRVGTPNRVATEFKKPHGPANSPEMVGWFGLLAVTLLTAIFSISNWFSGRFSLLLSAHIFCVTVGYVAVLLTGGLGTYFVCRRFFQGRPSPSEESLNRTTLRLNCLSFGLILTGFVLGMIWTKQNRGGYLDGDPRESGAFYVLVWLLASCLVQRYGRLSGRTPATLCIIGNIIVCLAWFGAGVLAHGFRVTSYWPLHALCGAHLLFLLLDVVPEHKTTEA